MVAVVGDVVVGSLLPHSQQQCYNHRCLVRNIYYCLVVVVDPDLHYYCYYDTCYNPTCGRTVSFVPRCSSYGNNQTETTQQEKDNDTIAFTRNLLIVREISHNIVICADSSSSAVYCFTTHVIDTIYWTGRNTPSRQNTLLCPGATPPNTLL
jgi:hypothetical protein